MSEQLKILEMIQKGQISPAEAMELLEALKGSSEPIAGTGNALMPSVKRKYKFLKIRVTSDNKTVNVNVNIPILLLRSIGGIAGKVAAYIPANTRAQLEAKGIDINEIDFGMIIDDLISGTLEDPNIIDVEAWDDEHKTMVIVKVFAE